jgi:hypothetical protein
MNAEAQRLFVVSNEIPDPPYPSDTAANGWHPELHVDRIASSDTWTLAEDDERPWLLRIWFESWRSVPVGSMPSERRLFARRIGCKTAFLEAHAEILLRGWALHSDGLLYHGFIAEQVNAMLNKRRKSAEKVAAWREKQKQKEISEQQESVTGYNESCNGNVPVSNRQEQEQEQEQDLLGTSVPLSTANADRPAACPHMEIIDAYHEALPELPGIVKSRWSGSKDEEALRARWREDARHQSLDFWRRFFAAVRTNPHWMGENDRGWSASLRWLVQRSSFDKVIDRMANARREVAHG